MHTYIRLFVGYNKHKFTVKTTLIGFPISTKTRSDCRNYGVTLQIIDFLQMHQGINGNRFLDSEIRKSFKIRKTVTLASMLLDLFGVPLNSYSSDNSSPS